MSQFSKCQHQPCQHQHCQQLLSPGNYHEHMNLHAQPHELVPKTRPNNLKKLGLSKILHLDDSTDQSDIAVRSILPDEIPQPDVGRREVPNPEHQGQFSKGSGKDGKVGKGIDNGQGRSSNIGFMRGNGSPVNDQLDLQSNVIGVEVQGLQSQKLDIEKEVDLKPKKTIINKKEIHKYQNSHNSARQTTDLGGCEKKVIDNPLAYSRNVMSVPVEPVYEIKEIQKSFLSSPDPKNRATVAFSRKTAQSSPYNAIETKSINNPAKVGRTVPRQIENYQGNNINRNINRNYSDQESDNSGGYVKRNSRGGDRPYPLHHHECPDCHGFYCSTCKSTIPPSFRPFWDQNQKPEIIQYYKSIQQQAQKQIRHRKQCPHCDQHK